MQIVMLLLDKYLADEVALDFQAACQSGSQEMIEFVIGKKRSSWEAGLYGALKAGNVDLVKIMMKNMEEERGIILENYPQIMVFLVL